MHKNNNTQQTALKAGPHRNRENSVDLGRYTIQARAAARTDLERERTKARFSVFMWVCSAFIFPLLLGMSSILLYMVYDIRQDVTRLQTEMIAVKMDLAETKTELKEMREEFTDELTEIKIILTEIRTRLPPR